MALEEKVSALAAAIEAKDPCTSQHLARVAVVAEAIARAMRLPESTVREVHLAAVLHDLGKLWIDTAVLKKESRLTSEEWEHMKQHPRFGVEALSDEPLLERIREGLLHHHERIDGRGYPAGLAGDEIPLLARIIAVADTFDAMTSDRPYRKALAAELAVDEILCHRGTQFCPKVVDAFLRALSIEGMHKERIAEAE